MSTGSGFITSCFLQRGRCETWIERPSGPWVEGAWSAGSVRDAGDPLHAPNSKDITATRSTSIDCSEDERSVIRSRPAVATDGPPRAGVAGLGPGAPPSGRWREPARVPEAPRLPLAPRRCYRTDRRTSILQ